MPDTAALKRVIARATLEARPLEVVALGGSVLQGLGCDFDGRSRVSKGGLEGWRWTEQLERLSNFPGTPLRMSVQNLAMGATTSGDAAAMFSERGGMLVDIVIVDYGM